MSVSAQGFPWLGYTGCHRDMACCPAIISLPCYTIWEIGANTHHLRLSFGALCLRSHWTALAFESCFQRTLNWCNDKSFFTNSVLIWYSAWGLDVWVLPRGHVRSRGEMRTLPVDILESCLSQTVKYAIYSGRKNFVTLKNIWQSMTMQVSFCVEKAFQANI